MNETQTNKSNLTNQLRWVLIAAFVIAALLTAYLTFNFVRDLVVGWKITNLPGISISEANPPPADVSGEGPVSDPQIPLQPLDGPIPQPWDGAKPVTMLLMGLDYRDWAAGEGPPRTDTMILFMLDPVNRTAGILNIPRDLWVNIPGGFSYGRINTAYQLGEAYKWPGGGPALAIETVEELLGVPIDYYAQIDFIAFERFIDLIDGIQVDIKEPIKVDPLGDDNTKTLKPGVQVLPGNLALAYARARKTDGGDFDRADRQYEVILGIRDRVMNLDTLRILISRAPQIYNEISAGVNTNLNLEDAIRLGWIAAQLSLESIKRGSIGAEQVAFAVSPDGSQQVLKPLTDKVRQLRDEIFTYTGPASPATGDQSLEQLVQAEAARIRLLNGTYAAGLAASTTDYLKTLGINVVEAGNADQLKTYTEITFYTGKPYTVKYLVDLMKIDAIRIKHFYDPNSPVDIAITLGQDWANIIPSP